LIGQQVSADARQCEAQQEVPESAGGPANIGETTIRHKDRGYRKTSGLRSHAAEKNPALCDFSGFRRKSSLRPVVRIALGHYNRIEAEQ
jgi:hypothetical protein